MHKQALPKRFKIWVSLALGISALTGSALLSRLPMNNLDPITLSSIPNGEAQKPLSGQLVSARPMPVCGTDKRNTCIVDGDTFWLEGAKYRIANIDTPELKGKCRAEQTTAKRARQRLMAMIDEKPVQLRVTGKDRYGRALVLVSDTSGDIGNRLVGEGLAEVWGGASIDWCRV